MPTDRRVAPCPTERTRDALVIQSDGDAARRGPGGKLRVDPPHDPSLVIIDATLAVDWLARGVHALDDIVSIAQAAARLAGLDPAAQATPCLVGEVFQEKGVHCAFEPDMQVADLPFGQRDDFHACERHPLEHAGDVLLVAADPIEGFSKHDIEPASGCIAHQRLDAGPDQRGAGDRTVLVAVHDGPALSLGVHGHPLS